MAAGSARNDEGTATRILDTAEGLLQVQQGDLRFPGTPREAARVVIACLEGAMLVAPPYGDIERFHSVAASLLAALSA